MRLEPDFDILRASRSHVQRLLLRQFNPLSTLKASLLVVPELSDILSRSPLVLSEGLKHLESNLKNPLTPRSGGCKRPSCLGSPSWRRPSCMRPARPGPGMPVWAWYLSSACCAVSTHDHHGDVKRKA